MGSTGKHYPVDLNPFGDDEEEEEEEKVGNRTTTGKSGTDDYPDHLDPFGEDEMADYDDSLNPFADEDKQQDSPPQEDAADAAANNNPAPNTPDASLTSEQVPDASLTQIDSSEPPKPLPRKKRKNERKKAEASTETTTIDDRPSVSEAALNDLELESQEGKPCLCNSTFYRHCPSKSNCLEDVSLDPLLAERDSKSEDGSLSPDHDNLDPDHVDIEPEYTMFSGPSHKPHPNHLNFNGNLESPSVERHRKVYLTRRTKDWKPKIHKFTITIPVTPPTYEPAGIPEPKPFYKLRKYTTYKNKQEVQMVPVTKTIIKPIGVTADQIIDDGDTGMMSRFPRGPV